MALPKNRKPTPPPTPQETVGAQRDLQGNIINPYDPVEEKVFTQLPLDETLNSENDGQFQFEEEEKPVASPRHTTNTPQPVAPEITPSVGHNVANSNQPPVAETNTTQGFTETDNAPVLESRIRREQRLGETQEVEDNTDSGVVLLAKGKRRTEVDVKKKTVLPFGSSRRQQKVTKAERDARKNISKKVNRGGKALLGVMGVIVLIGVYGLIPKDGLTEKEQLEAAQISAQVSRTTGFPMNAGGGIATDFIKAYLTVQSDTATNDILSYYYTGSTTGQASSATSNQGIARTATSSFSQTLLYEPSLYGARSRDATMAQYIVGAYVQKKATEGDKVTTEKPKMLFFSVNVLYDPKTETFAIAPDSPTLVPAEQITSQNELAPAKALGEGTPDSKLAEEIKSVVNGYVQGYSVSTDADTSPVDQYTTVDADVSTKRGLGGSMELASGGNAVTFEAYPSKKEGDTVTEIEARVRVTWVDRVQDENATSVSADPAQVTYGSQYMMTLVRQADGRFLVQSFAPEAYTPSE